MGDLFQVVVDETATEADVQASVKRVIEWLVTEDIVQPAASHCILGSGQEYCPGSNYRRAIDMSRLGIEDETAIFQKMAVNGLEVVTERTVFDAGQAGFSLVCDKCGGIYGFEEIGDAWGDAVDEWFTEAGDGLLACPDCGVVRPVTKWKYEPQWGFGYLGFRFWNWPALSPEFIEELEHILEHPTKLVAGKL